ncbi:MAG: FMN-binding negative transcriptional regulator [Pseudomonadota bacterium]
MYKPKHFQETNEELMCGLMQAAPLATFIVESEEGIVANHIPFVFNGAELCSGELQAHIPRANPLSRILETERPCLTIFHGPDGYISPSYYATKPKHGKVVPTWNYCVVHVHGYAQLVDDAEWVRQQMELLTTLTEGSRPSPWAVSDAPAGFISALAKSLVGIRVSIERVEGKTKASQNQPQENQQSVLTFMDREGKNRELQSLMRSVLGDVNTR